MMSAAQLRALTRELEALVRAPGRGADHGRERSGRRAQGAYFTPEPLVAWVVAETLGPRLGDPALAWRRDGSPCLRVLDPCAGDGRFLLAAADLLSRAASARGHDPERARAAIIRRCIIGMERDPEFAALARARLGPGASVHCCEALLAAHPGVTGADIVIGNPPYIRSIHLARADPALWTALQGHYAATSHGEWDLYAAFIEQALQWTAPRGQVGLVVPSRWFTAAFAAPLRAELTRAQAVRGLVDFGAAQIFAGATTYAAVVFLSREPCDRVAVARHAAGQWQSGELPARDLAAAPWRLSVGPRRDLLDRLAAAAPALGDVARIVKGAGTNADPVYVLRDARDSGARVIGRSAALDAVVEIEAAACRPCIRGRDVHAYQVDPANVPVRCIVPYDRDGTLWSPGRIAAHPRLHAYLQTLRPVLEARERGAYADDRYYRFGRPQNMAFLGDPSPKIVVPDVSRGDRAVLDTRGAMVLDSAYAIRLLPDARGYDLPLLLAILRSPIVPLWLGETGVPLRGNYLRMKTAYLRSLPLPPLSARTARLSALIRQQSPGAPDQRETAALYRAVARAYGIDPRTFITLLPTPAAL